MIGIHGRNTYTTIRQGHIKEYIHYHKRKT